MPSPRARQLGINRLPSVARRPRLYASGVIPVFDGHNDLLLRLWRGEEPRHLQLEQAAEYGFAGGFFAVYVPSPRVPDPTTVPYAVPLAAPLDQGEAARTA